MTTAELTMLLRCILPPDSQMARIRQSWHEASKLQGKYFTMKPRPYLHSTWERWVENCFISAVWMNTARNLPGVMVCGVVCKDQVLSDMVCYYMAL